MPTELPPNANLEHLKKEAKALLAELRRKHPGSGSPGRPMLSDAQHTVARKYGFESWPKLKMHVQSSAALTPEILQRATAAFYADDAAALGRLLKGHHALRAKINEPVLDFDSPLIVRVRSRAMLHVL